MSRNRNRHPSPRGRAPATGQPVTDRPAVKLAPPEPHAAAQTPPAPPAHDPIADRARAAEAIHARYDNTMDASWARRREAIALADRTCHDEQDRAWLTRCRELGELEGRHVDPDPDPGPVPGDDYDQPDEPDEPDRGDEVDDEGGASEFRYLDPDPDGYRPPVL